MIWGDTETQLRGYRVELLTSATYVIGLFFFVTTSDIVHSYSKLKLLHSLLLNKVQFFIFSQLQTTRKGALNVSLYVEIGDF